VDSAGTARELAADFVGCASVAAAEWREAGGCRSTMGSFMARYPAGRLADSVCEGWRAPGDFEEGRRDACARYSARAVAHRGDRFCAGVWRAPKALRGGADGKGPFVLARASARQPPSGAGPADPEVGVAPGAGGSAWERASAAQPAGALAGGLLDGQCSWP